MRRVSWVVGLLTLSVFGCGPSTSPPDSSATDAGQDACPDEAELASCDECEMGVCRALVGDSLIDREPVSVSCGEPVGGRAAAERCGASSECVSGLCTVSGFCVAACVDGRRCDVSARCQTVQVMGLGGNTHPASGCVPDLTLPPAVEVRRSSGVIDEAGGLDVQMQESESLYILRELCGRPVEVRSMRVGDMTVFDADGDVYLNPVSRGYSPLAFWLPSGDWRAPNGSGTLRINTNAESSFDYEVYKLTPSFENALLDLDIFYVSLPGVVPEGERGPERVSMALEEVARIFAPAGIEIGEVRQHEVGGMLGDEFTIVDFDEPGVSDELPELFRLSAGIASPSVPVFLVRSVDFALGLAGGIPGPLGMAGTSGSGIVLSYGVLDTPRELGQAIAHELAHYLGLFHTTESAGSVREGFADTPVCPPGADANGDGFFSSEECAGAGAENLMFWSPGGEQLSASQAELLRRAPILRAGVMGG